MRHAVLLAEPAARVDVEPLRRAACALLQLGRQGGEQLQAGGGELAAEPELGGRADEERLRLVDVEAGQLRPVPALEAVAAGRAARRHDRNAGGGERLCVALDRALGDLEPLGKLVRRQVAPRLQHEQKGHETRCAHRSRLLG